LVVVSRQPVRRHVFHEVTRSLCPECGRVVDAQVLIRDGGVYLRKHCPAHGWHEALISSDADWYLNSIKYNKPGAIPHTFATAVERGCPDDCGLCPEHQQHTCVGVIEVTDRCDLMCPTCFADAGSGSDLSLEQIEFMLDRLVAMEGQPEVVQISGGEPTTHPQILDILEAVGAHGIRCTMLNTNGIRLAQDPGFVRQLARFRPFIYLQFDGVTAETHSSLRGQDLRAVKQRALDNIAEAGLYTILVPTIVQGLNDGEIGDILRFGLESPSVLGVSYQPVAYSGRCLNHHDPLHRATVPQVLHSLESQTGGLFRVDDFRPVPCPHPSCSACTCAYVDGETVIPIPRLLNVDDYLDFLTNSAGPAISDQLGPALDSLWSMANVAGSDKTTAALNCVACGISIPLSAKPELSPEQFFVVNVHGFMDEHTFDLKRLMKCCIHEVLPDGRAVPFCAYNNLGYREQAKLEMERSDDR
jgi:uncharacterized radical SAM superfamily Fe-S cluster-containing enzyme